MQELIDKLLGLLAPAPRPVPVPVRNDPRPGPRR